MESVFDIIEKAKKSDVRSYGDVKISEFNCGCKILTLTNEKYFVFKEICGIHKIEYEEKTGDLIDRIILKDK